MYTRKGKIARVATSPKREEERSDVDWRGCSQPGPESWSPTGTGRKAGCTSTGAGGLLAASYVRARASSLLLRSFSL